ncbi:chromosome 5 open reading frame 42, partial [Elysia marginata]
ELLSMDGRHTMAMNAWKQQLSRYKELGNVKNASRLLHSLLYTYILRNDLTAAVAFVDSLIVKANPSLEDEVDLEQMSSTHDIQPSLMTFVTKTLRSQAFHEPDMVPCIRDRAIRQMVQSMARFMVAYFSNQTVFIFPPHNPVPLPAVHFETSIANSRIIPKYHEDLASSIRHQQLSQVWTVERALEYLLLSGLLCEAVWFADCVGDWKAAYQLSVAHTLHRRLAPPVYVGSKKPVSLPDWLSPDAIMKGKLERLVHRDLQLNSTSSDLTTLTKVMEDIALAGVMGYVEVGSWLLAELVTKLKALLGQMTPLVTKDFYLPAPPLFCPQPAANDKVRVSLEVDDEIKLRHQASSVIQLALCVMNAAHLSIPAGAWYAKVLEVVQQKATQFKITTEGPCLDLPDTLYSYLEMQDGEGSFDIDSEDPSVKSVQASFRDLCSLLWLLHARDKLSLCLRSREKFLSLGLDVENNEQWLRECFLTLQWAVHMVAFSRYLSDEASIYKVILSVLLELPATEDTANILAEHMYSQDNLHPEVQDRLERMLNSWQSVIIVPEADGRSVGDSLDMDEEGRKSVTFLGASPRGKSLSVYFHKQCMAADKTLKKKKQCYGSYEEYVFAESLNGHTPATKPKNAYLNIGSRPFETKRSYLEFLDTFYTVSFSKVLEVMASKDKLSAQPFLRCFARDIVDREMLFFVQRVAGSAHKKAQGLSVLAGGEGTHLGLQGPSSYGQRNKTRGRSVPGRTSGRADVTKDEGSAAGDKPVGLFRGKSMVEAPLERSHACVKRYDSEPSHLDDPDLSEFSAHPSHQRRSSLASRFSQSEETLYGSRGGAGQRPELGWSLTVNFGKKYTALQQLLEWLEVWGNKTHTLGLGCGEEELLHMGSQLKLQIPAQLIVLALWLLEHKYHQSSQSRQRSLSRSGKPTGRNKRASRGRRAQRLSQSPPGSHSPAGSIRSTRSGAGTPPIYPENSLLSHQSAPRRTASPNFPSQQAAGSRHSSPATPPPGPAQASTLEEDQIIDAYTQVLDGPEDSSSIAVSSLASDELDEDLKHTHNALKRSNSPTKDNSALNHTIYPKDDSPERGAPKPQNSSTPKQADSIRGQRTPSVSPPRTSQQAAMERSVSERTSRSDRRGQQQREVSQGSLGRGQHNTQTQAVGNDIAVQLQAIIRDELHRIMEIQHRSVLAMMGALDEVSGPGHAPQAVIPPPQPAKNASTSQRGRPQRHSKSLSQNKAENQENLEDESVAEMVSFKEELVAQHSVQAHARPRDVQGGGHIRGALSELHNLQAHTAQPSLAEDINSRANRIFSQSHGPPSRNGSVHFPLLAWENNQDRSSGSPFPLLHISSAQEFDSDPFRNLRRFLPQVPPPQPYRTPPSFSQPSQPSSLPLFSQFPTRPDPQQQIPPPLPYDPITATAGGFPLLSIPSAPSQLHQPAQPGQPGFFPLLRILPPGTSEQELQRSKIEETRQRLLNKFQQQVLQDKENVDQGMLAQRLLRLEPQARGEPLDSARSEKSLPSEKLPSEKLISKEEVQAEEQERAASAQSVATCTGGMDGTLSDAGHTGSAAGDASINDGYALPRGIFESYLQLGEHLMGPEAGQTSAAFQLKMAQAMQKQVEKRIRPKVDFSTMTQEQVDLAMATDPAMEVVRTAEAATSITKDTGVDPIEEAVRDYNLKRHNNVIPPDIFMGLRFADQDGQSGVAPGAPSDEPSKGRAFLNVVDIRASAVLRDIPERLKKEEKVGEDSGQTDVGTAMLASQRAALQMGALEDTLREKFAPQTSASMAARGHDSLTVRMFDQLQAGREDRMSVAVIPRSSVSEPKAAMLRRLQDMSDQIKAIDDMSQNIEREFKSSHLLLNTIQDVNASIQRSRSPSPDRSRVSPQRHKELRYSLEDKTEEFDEEDEVGSGGTLTPRLPAPKTSAKSPQASARSARSKSTLASQSASEVAELLTEVLAEQGVDLESAGYPKELAQQLEMDVREQMVRQDVFAKSRITPREKLETMKKAEEEEAGRRTREQREELKKWMASKFHERQEDYRRQRQELIEREPKPFKSGQAATRLNLQKLDEERSERRQHMVADFMNQRLSEAEHLMGSIIVDKPEMPAWGALATGEDLPTSQPYARSTHAGRNAKRRSRSPARRQGPTLHKPQTSSRSPSETKQSQSTMPTTVKGILKPSVTSTTLAGEPNRLSASDLHLPNLASLSAEGLSVDSSADIINYARQILEMEGATPLDSYEISESPPLALGRRQPSQSPAREVRKTAPQPPPPQQAKMKSFADMVRLQRPAVTRKWQDVNRHRQQSAAAAARQATSPGQKTWTLQDPNLVNGKPKEYARTMSTVTTRSASQRGPAHRPKTYVEQLKSLSSRAGSIRRGHTGQQGKIPVKMRTFLRSHGPVHQPKTYTEQLRELNPHPQLDTVAVKTRGQATYPSGPTSSTGLGSRASSRPRPYGDPYSEMDYEELASVLSDWDMDDKVRNIIYGGSTAASSVVFRDDIDMSLSGGDIQRPVAPSEGQSDYFDVVMQGDGHRSVEHDDFDLGLGVGDYRSSVDVHEIERIADAASVGSGSVLSVIDWDAVNDLIKDV